MQAIQRCGAGGQLSQQAEKLLDMICLKQNKVNHKKEADEERAAAVLMSCADELSCCAALLMELFCVLIENLFAEVDQVFDALPHKQQKQLGRQDVGKMLQCCVFLHYVCKIMHGPGRQTSAYCGSHGLLNITLSDFLDASHEFH
jgi:hypothetical protein